MKTLRPFVSSSWIVLTLAACGGSDDDAPVDVPPSSPAAEPTPSIEIEPSATTPSNPQPETFEILLERNVLIKPRPEVTAEAPGFTLSWRDCGVAGTRAVQCAELQVPLDHDDPDGERILIALSRILAPSDVPHRGSLFYNPGGPGGSGKEIARVLASSGSFDAVAPGFDVIGFDPRGVGDSSALQCEFIDAYLRGDTGEASPDEGLMQAVSDYGLEGAIEDLTWLSDQCRNYWGDFFDHLGSNQVVRDVELMRVALGEDKLNFLGMSYGTRLGALYAQQYPDRVRAIVLDAPVPSQASIVEQVQGQFDELLVVHEAFFAECEAGRVSCPPDPRSLFDAYVAAADALAISSPMLEVWQLGLSYGFGLDLLPYLLQQQAEQPTSNWMFGMLPLVESDTTGFIQSLNVNCADNAAPLLSLDEATARLDAAVEQSPLFAAALTPIATCNGWTVAPDPVEPLTAPGSPPILVVGGTHDLRTPARWAQDLAGSLENAVLLTSEHWGHTIVGDGSTCVDAAVRAYLVDLVLPEDGRVCPAPAR